MGSVSKRNSSESDPYLDMKSHGRTGAAERQRQMQASFEEETAIGVRSLAARKTSNPFKTPGRRKAFDAAIARGLPRKKAWVIARNAEPGKVDPKPKAKRSRRDAQCARLPANASKDELRAAHKARMAERAADRRRFYEQSGNIELRYGSASRNRHTGKPHEHAREIARRQRQEAR